MALRNILVSGEPSLRRTSREVTNFDERLHTLLDDMKETLAHSAGVGLAAPQVGVLRRAVIVLETNVENGADEYYMELINPVITMREGSQTGPEGCLSVPGNVGIVERPLSVVVQALDRQGEFIEFECFGLTARAVCHEIDHLEGVLFPDIAERMLSKEEIDELYADEENDEDDYEEYDEDINEDSEGSE